MVIKLYIHFFFFEKCCDRMHDELLLEMTSQSERFVLADALFTVPLKPCSNGFDKVHVAERMYLMLLWWESIIHLAMYI